MIRYTIHSADIDDFATWQPAPCEAWQANVQLFIENEAFSFQLCSLAWIEERIRTNGGMFTGRILVMREYEFDQFRALVDELVRNCENDDWEIFGADMTNWTVWDFDPNHWVRHRKSIQR